jgi:predicted GNAT family acetyltransferase
MLDNYQTRDSGAERKVEMNHFHYSSLIQTSRRNVEEKEVFVVLLKKQEVSTLYLLLRYESFSLSNQAPIDRTFAANRCLVYFVEDVQKCVLTYQVRTAPAHRKNGFT